MGEIKVLKFRDIQVAEDVAKKAALGWFDVEFIMYGCAYLDREKDKVYYKVSSQEEDIYNFIEKSIRKDVYPSKVMVLRKRYPLPAGMREVIAENVKKELAKQLKIVYPKSFFKILHKFADENRNNTAALTLWHFANELEGVFEEKKLSDFEELVHYSYSCHVLTLEDYKKLCIWIEEEKRNMEDSIVSKDLFQKEMYGIIYEKNGIIKYMADAQKANIYRNVTELEELGGFVGPIYSKSYWHHRLDAVPMIVKNFKQELKEKMESSYLDQIKELRQGKNSTMQKEYKNAIDEVRKQFGEDAANTMKRYGYRWGIFS